jgi:diaminopimelate epimerase
MKAQILIADPAGNITALVLSPVAEGERVALSAAILADPSLHVEQVGFVLPPSAHPAEEKLWRLEMMGGEFCGNAARSFGLYLARRYGYGKNCSVLISGAKKPVALEIDVESGLARAEMPLPKDSGEIQFEGRILPVFVFDGITHIIAPDLKSGRETFFAVKKMIGNEPDALGVLFLESPGFPPEDEKGDVSLYMKPAVYVRATDTLVFESSCGSGSAALGAWLGRKQHDGTGNYSIAQPGGIIDVRVRKERGTISEICIGGKVRLGDPFWFSDSPVKDEPNHIKS